MEPEQTKLHLLPRDAMKEIIRRCIESGNDEEFVEEILEASGFEVMTSRKHGGAVWKLTYLITDAANLELFPRGSLDEAAFLRVYEIEGHMAAKTWMSKHLRCLSTSNLPVNRAWKQRLLYLPVDSLLEARYRDKKLKPKRGAVKRHGEERMKLL